MICPVLDCFYGAWIDPSNGTWTAIKVDSDGIRIIIEEGFATEAEAADCADLLHQTELMGADA